ncbi:MAG TPA: amino acid adenylation domain-containing protein, partial [Streptosporangiaceae bacterium]
INTVPVRVRIDPAQPVTTWLAGLQERQATLMNAQHLGLADIQRLAGPGAIFDTLMVFENYPRLPKPAADGVSFVPGQARDAAHYPLTLVIVPGDQFQVHVDHHVDLFSGGQVAGLLGHLFGVLGEFVADPGRLVGQLGVSSKPERDLVVKDWNDTAAVVPGGSLPGLFAAQALKTPHAVAVAEGEREVSYAELQGWSARIAQHLTAAGVGRGDRVAVLMDRSAGLVAVLLGVMKAGAAYVPVDPAYPGERIAFMLADAAPAVVVCTAATREVVPAGCGVPVVVADDPVTVAQVAACPAVDLAPGPGMGDVAYVIYTSGSTGVPKGVVVSHAGIGGLAASQIGLFGTGAGSRVLAFAAAGFDASVSELCMALLAGACLVIAPPDQLPPRAALGEVAARLGITHVTVPPAVLAAEAGLPGHLATVVVAGEACPPAVAARWAGSRRVINAYGPTEATVCVSMAGPLAAGAAVVAVGRPVANTRVFVLDGFGQLLPPGMRGEVYVAGPGLAHGYLGQPALTSTRFTACPFGPAGARMYRTGDLGYWDQDGQLVFAGRADAQVKIRGHRVEPGEIEAALAACPAITQAAITTRTTGDTQQLAAYLTPAASPEGLPEVARQWLAARLPEHMIPTTFVVLDTLPLTPHGKVDRAALPGPDYGARTGHQAPASPREELLCTLFAEVLKLDRVGAGDSFLALGGDSIMSMQL